MISKFNFFKNIATKVVMSDFTKLTINKTATTTISDTKETVAMNFSDRFNYLSRDQLIQQINILESKLKATDLKYPVYKPDDNAKFIDFDSSSARKIALKVAYKGTNYLGFSSYHKSDKFSLENIDGFHLSTIEDYIFRALLKLRLIKDKEWSEFSVCGRTDKGVSANNQVISLKVKSKIPKQILEKDPLALNYIETFEFDYPDLMNRILPNDINVLSWCPVEDKFNARFDCSSRHYKYFFLNSQNTLDIGSMQIACEKLVGERDFRHLCKVDKTKDIETFSRHIKAAYIEPNNSLNDINGTNEFEAYELNIIGNSFLWHQVRCIMSVLFLIGNRQEKPEIFDMLFSNYFEGKPDYEIASPYPLMLYGTNYEVELRWQPSQHYSSYYKLNKLVYESYVDMFILVNNRSSILENKIASNTNIKHETQNHIVLGAGCLKKCNKYRPLAKRNQLDPPHVRRQAFKIKRQEKESKK